MFEKKYQRALLIFAEKFPKIFQFVFPHRRVIKFLFSGGLAALFTVLTLYFFTDIVGLWYVASSVIGFFVGFGISFTLQKFWTFRDNSVDKIKSQTFFYLITIAGNLIINTYGIYVLVHYFGFFYIVAQIIIGLLIACVSYFIYGKLIFKKKQDFL